MKAYKSKNLCKDIAKDKDLDEVMINDIISFYYEDVRKEFKGLDNPRIKLDNLGTFEVKQSSLERYVKRNESFIKETNPDTLSFNYYKGYKKVKDNMSKIEKLLSSLKEENLRKAQKRKERDEFIKDMEA